MRLEDTEVWEAILEHKNNLSLRALAQKFDVSAGALSAALRRTGTARDPARGEDLPPEKEAKPATRASSGRRGGIKARPGSKDEVLLANRDLLGVIPDGEVADRIGVSVRTVAAFRARHKIEGFKGRRRSASAKPRTSRIDPFKDLVGTVPDRVVAERAGVSVSGVRAYRKKHGISLSYRNGGAAPRLDAPAPRAPAEPAPPAPAARVASGFVWKVVLPDQRTAFVVGKDLVDAARQASAHEVVSLERAGPLL